MSYADLFPHHSYYLSHHPVRLTIDGCDEEGVTAEEVPFVSPVGVDFPRQHQHQHQHQLSHHQHLPQQLTYQPTQHALSNSSQSPPVLLFVDTNILLSSLSLLSSLHQLLLSLISPSPITLIIPSPVLRELDGLKSSQKAVDGISHRTGETSRHAITIGTLARKANRWLLDCGQKARLSDGGSELVRVIEADAGNLHMSADDQILSTCVLTSSTFLDAQSSSPRIILFTSDKNLAVKAELSAHIETLTIIPKDPRSLLARLGIDSSLPIAMDLSHDVEAVTQEGGTMDIDDDFDYVLDVDDELPSSRLFAFVPPSLYASFKFLLEVYIPPALDRHIHRLKSSHPQVLLAAELPSDPPPTSWSLPDCIEALTRLFRFPSASWSSTSFGVYQDRLVSPDPVASPPLSLSRHTPLPSSSASRPVLYPPSIRYVRQTLLPRLAAFFSPAHHQPDRRPSFADWQGLLEAIQVLFGSEGGQRFLGDEGHRNVMDGVNGIWLELPRIRAAENGIDVFD